MYRAYEYGCLAPTVGEDVLVAEIERRNALWNELVEIDREDRRNYRTETALPEDLLMEDLKAHNKGLCDEIRARRKSVKAAKLAKRLPRSAKADVAGLIAEVKDIKAKMKALTPVLKEKREAVKAQHKREIEALNKKRMAAVSRVAHASGLWWGNREEVVNSYVAARSLTLKQRKELQIHESAGEGKCGVRFQYGLPVSEVFGNDTRLQIDPVAKDAWTHPVRAERRRLCRTKIRLRVRSENGKPLWVELPMVMHRSLPENGRIQTACVLREAVKGTKYQYRKDGSEYDFKYGYKVVLVVDEPSQAPRNARNNGIVGVDLGWRLTQKGLRVAYWYGEGENAVQFPRVIRKYVRLDADMRSGELFIPSAMLAQFAKCKDLESIRDKHFNDAKATLQTWMKAQPTVPDWLRKATEGLPYWPSRNRLLRVVHEWDKNRFPGDHEIVAYLKEWQTRQNHLNNWRLNLDSQLRRRRREVYRLFALSIARTYYEVVLEQLDLTEMQVKPPAEDGPRMVLPADHQRTIAAVSTLRNAIFTTCLRDGVALRFVEAPFTTQECSFCGHTEKFDAANHIHRTCPECDSLWDQDWNAAKNLVARGLDGAGELAKIAAKKNRFKNKKKKADAEDIAV